MTPAEAAAARLRMAPKPKTPTSSPAPVSNVAPAPTPAPTNTKAYDPNSKASIMKAYNSGQAIGSNGVTKPGTVPTQPTQQAQKTTVTPTKTTTTTSQQWPYGTTTWTKENQMAGDSFSFQKDVKSMWTWASDYMAGRNNTIAQTTVDKMNQLASQGQKLDNLAKDKILNETIASMGWQVDFNSPDRQNTIKNINDKITQNVGWNIDDFYSKGSTEYNNVQKYIWTSTSSLVSQITSGSLTLENMKNLQIADPNKYAEVMAGVGKQKEIQGFQSDITAQENLYGIEGTVVEKKDTIQDKMAEMYNQMYTLTMNSAVSGKGVIDEYKKAINNPEITKMNDDLSAKTKEIADIDDQLYAMKGEVEKQYPWLSKSQLNSILADRSDDLQKMRRNIALDATELQTNLKNRMDTAQQDYKLGLESFQMDQEANKQKMSMLNMQYGILKDTQDRQDKFTMIDLQADKEWEMYTKKMDANRAQTQKEVKFKEGDATSADPELRNRAVKNSVEETLKEFDGLPMTRSKDQMVEDISAGLASGKYKSLGEAVTKNIREPIQGKAEYKLRSAKKAGIDITPSLTKVWDSAYYRDQWSNQYKALWQATGNVVEQGTVQSAIQKYTSIKDGTVLERWQCGAFVNDYLATVGAGVSCADSMQSKLDMINQPATRTPTQGSVVVMGVNSEQYKENWHVAIVTGVNQDWSINIKESNYKSPNTVSSRTIKANDPLVKGFYAPNVGWQVGGGTNKTTNSYLRQATTSQSSGTKNNAIQKAYDQMVKDGESEEEINNFLKQKVIEWLPNTAKTEYENRNTASSDIWTAISTIDAIWAKWFDFAPNRASKKINDLKWTFWWATPEYNELMAVVNQWQAVARNKLFGASLTEWEKSASDIFLVNPEVDTLGTIKAKMAGQKVLADVFNEKLLRQVSGNPMTQDEVTKRINEVRASVLWWGQPQVQSKQIKDRAPSTSSSSSSSTSTWYSFVDPSKVWAPKKPVYAGMSKK